MLKTKSIFAEVEPDDGLRISIMSRHTLSDGISPDPRISQDLYDDWWPDIAPKPTLVGSYYRREITWLEFAKSYNNDLTTSNTALFVARLVKISLDRDVTVMCIEETPAQCHRRLLAEECRRLSSNLKVLVQ